MLKYFYILIWITVFKSYFCRRRMGLGNESIMGKKYLVYFVKSPYSKGDNDAWLCAGAIVTPSQILTAAACLVETDRIYAIAGYKKYVHAKDIEKDKCANTWKKKVVRISVPKEYTTSIDNEVEWMNVDIGVATIQEPYNFNDQSYHVYCSYVPESVMINYEKENEVENTRAIALGWGGKKVKNKELTTNKHKPKILQEATTTIIEKTFCAKLVSKNRSKEIVNKYLLCASGNGFLGDERDGDETTLDSIREELSIGSINIQNSPAMNNNQSNEMTNDDSRKSSLIETCQNDHGGPLITWVGSQELILGVALNGLCNPDFDCVGPRIYVSTAATAQIIKCLLETNDTSRITCNEQLDDKRYQINDLEIKWPEDSKINFTSSTSIQKTRRRRQNDETGPLIMRPTKDINALDEQVNPRYNPIENPYETPLDNQPDTPQENRQENPNESLQNYYNEPAMDSVNPSQAEPSQGVLNEEVINQSGNPQGYISQQQKESQNQPLTDRFNQPQIESYNLPEQDPYHNQPPIDSFHIQPQVESQNSPEMESFDQRQTESNNQPHIKPFNQNPMDPFGSSQMQIYSFNQPHMPSQNQLQQTNPQITTNEPLKKELFKQPEEGFFDEAFMFQLPYKKSPDKLLHKTQAESINKSLLESFKSSQSNVEALTQTEHKKTQSTDSQSRIESFKLNPTESYDPLDIIMSDIQPDEDVLFKRPAEEPNEPPPAKLAVEQPSVQEPEPDKPVKHSISSQEFPPHQMQFSVQSPAHPSDLGRALRKHPEDPPSELHPSQKVSQTFDDVFSQLHAGPERSNSASPPAEETFEELYKKLHDGQIEESRDQDLETRIVQTTAPEIKQTEAKIMNEPPMTGANDGHTQDPVNVRNQLPLEYPEYNR